MYRGGAGRTRQAIGKLGERTAEKFLTSRGFTIIQRNFSTPFGEIDLIAEHDGHLVFVEVKTRRSERFGPPLCAISHAKQKHVIKNCQFYTKRYGLYDRPCRIDAVGINLDMDGNLLLLRHVKNAITVNSN